MLRPISPFVEYVVNYDYISKVLCVNKEKPETNCNGKCHLTNELKQQQEEENKNNHLVVSLEEYPIGFVYIICLEREENTQENIKNHFNYCENYNLLFSDTFFHPPKMA